MPNTVTKWAKFGEIKAIAFLGKEVIAIASGIHVMFINLNTKDEKVEKFNDKDRGDGVSCLTGHPMVPMFAITEQCLNPKISIFTYPKIIKVSTCIYKKATRLNGYISSTFAGVEYLITLTSFPDFQLIVWLWRTGENLKVIDTKIMDDIQLITSSPSSPFFLTQMGENTGQIMLYEMTVCSKIISLIPLSNFLLTERIVSSSWTYDGNLLLCDSSGNVSLFYIDGKRHHVIINSNIQSIPNWRPLVVDFRIGAAVVNNESQILFYRKLTVDRIRSGSLWKFIWQIETCSQPVFIIRHPQRDSLLFYTNKGEIIEVSVGDDDVPRMQMICYQGSRYLFLLSINPDGRCIGVIDTFNRLIILESDTSDLLSITSLDNYGKILQATAHINLPLIVTSTETGKCNIISVVDVRKPVIINSIYLIEGSLDKLKYSMAGNILGVANLIDGQLFIINNVMNMKFDVLTVLNIPSQIVDFLIYESKNECLVILVLVKAHSTICIGKHIIIYNVNQFTLAIKIERIVKLPHLFKSLHYGESAYDIIASPYLSKQLHLMKNSEDYKTTVLNDAVSLSHQIRDVNINTDSQLILTFGCDGLVMARSKTNIHLTLNMFVSHHRKECGIMFAIACLYYNIILCLGRNGNLIATQLSQSISSASLSLDLIDSSVDFDDSVRMLSTLTPIALDRKMNMTWIQLKKEERLKNEHDSMATKRASILKNFHDVKKQIKELLNANEVESDNAKLSIDTFDLDVKIRNEKIKLNTLKKEAVMKDLEDEIYCHEKLTEYLRETYWESICVPACSLVSLDGKIYVNNYTLPVEVTKKEKTHQERTDSMDISKQVSSVEESISSSNVPTPQRSKTGDIKIFKINENDVEEQLAMCGTTSHRWIHEDSNIILNQINRDKNYCDDVALNILTKKREKKLKEHFNNLFQEMRIMKEKEIKLANERIARINHCLSELKEMFCVEMPVNFDSLYLNWHEIEKPEMTIKVEDWEVYECLSKSMDNASVDCIEKLTDRYKTETPRDFFLDETLEKMMDGVLEVRWEDEIKKNIAKPDCLSKNIENCTKEELELIRMYEISVKNLEIERLKYKSILEKEILDVQDALKKGVNNFNNKLKTLFLERIKIESAISQENLMSLREYRQHQLHQQSMNEIRQIEIDELNPAVMEVKKFTEELTVLESTVNETKNRYENLIKREKLLEGKFRAEFSDLKQPMVEHLLRNYKKRPRIGHLICTSITYLTEMSKCIVSGEKSEILPHECVDFLKGMQSLDVMPSNLPSQIDSTHWFILCRIRRAKVEIETRLKSCAVELAEAEQTFSSHQKTIQNIQNRVHQLYEKIEDIKRRDNEKLCNVGVQLILKMGQIETQLSGNLSELGNAVLVPFDEVLRVNDAIVKAGRNKITAMNKTIVFRRTIEWQEWHHTCLKLKWKDLKVDLKDLLGVKVTKEIQKYLMHHSDITGPTKEAEISEKSIISTKQRYTLMIEKKTRKLIDIKKQINEWQEKNDRVFNAIDKLKLANLKLSLLVNDEKRVKSEKFYQANLRVIMKRNSLITKIQDNYENLLTLRNQLELLRLKIYPTLRPKDLMYDKKQIDNN